MSQAQIAKELGIKGPSVQRWMAKGRIAKQVATKAEIGPERLKALRLIDREAVE